MHRLIIAVAVLVAVLTTTPLAVASHNGLHAAVADEVTVTIKATDYAFEVPAQIEAGYVGVALVNAGNESHHAQIARLAEGTTPADLEAAMTQGPEALLPLLVGVGGPGIVGPGGTAHVILNLTPGPHVVICVVPGPDGVPHLAKGMVHTFDVVAPTQEPATAEPPADATVVMKDFHLELPAEIQAGAQTWKVVNDGPQPHELLLLKLAPDATVDAALAAIATPAPGSPPPFTEVGGMQGLMPGMSGWLVLDLEPGTYLAICYIPDPTTGKAHVALGMVMPFTVPGATATPSA